MSNMQPLPKPLRNQLEATTRKARALAEDGARAALNELGVGDASSPPHLDEARRGLRRRLRAHGRQLGDALNGGKAQTMERLVEEVAYEHWHRMLFARFLAENNLLMYPDPDAPVPVSLDDCNDLAADEGAANGWALAARYAAQMLPQIFRIDSPVFALKLPANYQVPLESLLAELAGETFTASDSLGWVYQFWQADNKERINQSEVKIGARELPAVTQLFTEPYMVSFLLDNALGAWWAARRLSEDDLRSAASEDELRHKAAIPGVPLEYLRFVKVPSPLAGEGQGEGGGYRWTPAAGTFPDWPEQLAELKVIDPCCGSGHFLVALLLMLVPLRMEMEGLQAQAAVEAVLRDNLHGLELDARCVELAGFALALTAWRYPHAGGYRPLPELQLACSGLSVSVAKEEWKALAREGGLGGKNLAIAMDWLHDSFRDAPVLGSLLNPAKTNAAKIVQWEQLSAALNQALAQETTDEQHEVAVVAQGLARASQICSNQYNLICTNVPFLTAIKYSPRLKHYVEQHYNFAKANLATAMVARCLELLVVNGVVTYVAPQSWMFLKGYKDFRVHILSDYAIRFIARLGEGGFESNQSNGEQVSLNIITNSAQIDTFRIQTADVSSCKSAPEKAHDLPRTRLVGIAATDQLSNSIGTISFAERIDAPDLSRECMALRGCGTGDSPSYVRGFWEVSLLGKQWAFHQTTPKGAVHFDGLCEIILWENERGRLSELAASVKHLNHAAQNWRRGKPNWGKSGIIVSQMAPFPAAIYTGAIYDPNCCAIVPFSSDLVPALWTLSASGELTKRVRDINQNRKVEVRTFLCTCFERDDWVVRAASSFPHGLPKPYSNDPTQWIFHGHPAGSVVWDDTAKWTAEGELRTDATVLQVAIARLLGYRWPAELDVEMELATEQREWVDRCEALVPFADEDGIVCIPPVRGELAAAERLRRLLAAAYGDDWSAGVENKLLASAEHAGKTLESWLREKFFTQHCKRFGHRPFLWHIWDGLPDGFAALVNYHKLDHKQLETLIYTYLGDWISRQKQDIASHTDGAQEKLAAAETLKQRLELVLKGEAPYDIFVRWKPLAEQPIGWDPDLNDGVRLNIRPFLSVPDIKKKAAGVLRDKPNIKWDKDRGKDVESAPWFNTFLGDRINDHHLTLAEKSEARQQENAS